MIDVVATDRLHVVTGGPGSGKSTLIDALALQGVAISAEIGRQIIREQVASGGNALPWSDALAFAHAMAVREMAAREMALATGRSVVLDRGIPDVIGFLRIIGATIPAALDRAARTLRYNRRVFLAPFWSQIYAQDTERRQTVDDAAEAEALMARTYRDYGYDPIELPRGSVDERVAFVLARL